MNHLAYGMKCYLYIFGPLFPPPEKIIILNLVPAISRKIFMFWLYLYMYI